ANLGAINAGFAQLRARAEAWLAGEPDAQGRAVYEWSLDLRYVGQNFELIVPSPSGNVFPGTLDEILQAFHRRHREFYGYDMAGQPVEVVNLRLVAAAPRPQPPQERPAQGGNVLKALIET